VLSKLDRRATSWPKTSGFWLNILSKRPSDNTVLHQSFLHMQNPPSFILCRDLLQLCGCWGHPTCPTDFLQRHMRKCTSREGCGGFCLWETPPPRLLERDASEPWVVASPRKCVTSRWRRGCPSIATSLPRSVCLACTLDSLKAGDNNADRVVGAPQVVTWPDVTTERPLERPPGVVGVDWSWWGGGRRRGIRGRFIQWTLGGVGRG
jgi:hypothetical protein